MPKGQPAGLGTAASGSSGGSGAATNSIAIDLSGMGGLDPNFWGDSDMTVPIPQRRILVSDMTSGGGNAMASGFFNPWMRQGYISPSVASLLNMTFISNAPATTLASVEYDPAADKIYFAEFGINISGGCSIYTATTNGNVPSSFNNSELTHADTVGSGLANVSITDLQIYTLNGLRTLFYSFTYTSSGVQKGAVGATDLTGTLSGASYVDGWLQGSATYNSVDVSNPITTLLSASPFLRLGSNGLMYIMDGSWIHALNGTTTGGTAGTLTAQVFNISPLDYIVDAIAYRQLMYLACQSSVVSPRTAGTNGVNFTTNCYVEVWNETTVTTSPTTNIVTDIISVPGIKSIQKLYISPKDTLRMICVAANGLTQIREYNGTQFALLNELGIAASPKYSDSLTVAENLTIWLGNDGIVYGHGEVLNNGTEVIAKIGTLPTSTGNTNPEQAITFTGAILYGAALEHGGTVSGYRQDIQGLTMGYINPNTSTVSVAKLYPFDKGTLQPDGAIGSFNQTAIAGNIFTGVHFLESSTASFYTGTRFLSQLSTVGFINIFMATGNNNSPAGTIKATINIYFNGSQTAWGNGSGFSVTDFDVNNGYKRLEINQPYVNTIQLSINYSTGQTLSDTSDFHPYVALIYYSPTNTRG